MAPERRARWRKEIDWLLSVTDHIVEMVPSKQISKDGTNMEVQFILYIQIFTNLQELIFFYKFVRS